MSKAQHTSGPWNIHSDADLTGEIFFNHSNGKEYLIAQAYSGNYGNSGPEREANAHLIAAAPELLTVLQEIIQIGTRNLNALADESLPQWKKARAAIAKARGSL